MLNPEKIADHVFHQRQPRRTNHDHTIIKQFIFLGMPIWFVLPPQRFAVCARGRSTIRAPMINHRAPRFYSLFLSFKHPLFSDVMFSTFDDIGRFLDFFIKQLTHGLCQVFRPRKSLAEHKLVLGFSHTVTAHSRDRAFHQNTIQRVNMPRTNRTIRVTTGTRFPNLVRTFAFIVEFNHKDSFVRLTKERTSSFRARHHFRPSKLALLLTTHGHKLAVVTRASPQTPGFFSWYNLNNLECRHRQQQITSLLPLIANFHDI